ncbi:MAG: EamA family transporter, partial [Gemmatimonadetes bacterium]|nr:EamA family transporter [Gemmatimonadota bacterium]
LPPFLMAGTRFLTAGAILYLFMRMRGVKAPVLVHWRSAFALGGMLLLFGNGAVVWAEHRIASGIAALLVAVEPLWIVLLEWLRPGGRRPSGRTVAGVVLGFAGLVILVGPQDLGGGRVDVLGAVVVVVAALSWAAGSLYSREAPLPSSPFLATAMQMLAGGVLLVTAGLLTGEAGRVDPSAFSVRSLGALAYLTVFGSLVAFTAYIWLLGVVSPSRASTYAYVNPLVAVVLGWALAGERLDARVALSAVVIVGAGAMIIAASRQAELEAPEEAEAIAAAPMPAPVPAVPEARMRPVRRARS